MVGAITSATSLFGLMRSTLTTQKFVIHRGVQIWLMVAMAQVTKITWHGGCFIDKTQCPKNGEAGIRLRVYSRRLWVIMVLIEHSVMLMRVMIMSLSPETEWILRQKTS